MSALSIQPTYPIFTDIDGQPLEAGFVWIGQANLDPQVNPINVYWDAALTIPAGQPIRTLGGYPSRNGTPARLYVNSDYSIRVMNKNGSVVYSAPAATERYGNIISSADITFVQAGAGAVTRTAQSKMREAVSVKDFGAVGDGVTDDAPDVTTARASSPFLIFTGGTFNFGSQVDLGKGTFLSDASASIKGYGFKIGGVDPSGLYRAAMRDFLFDGTGTTGASNGALNIDQMHKGGFYDIRIENYTGAGNGSPLLVRQSWLSSFYNLSVQGNTYGPTFYFNCNNVAVYQGTFANNTAFGCYARTSQKLVFNACDFEGNGGDGLTIDNINQGTEASCSSITVRDCYFENNGGADLRVGTGSGGDTTTIKDTIIKDNFFIGPGTYAIIVDYSYGAVLEDNYFVPTAYSIKDILLGGNSKNTTIIPFVPGRVQVNAGATVSTRTIQTGTVSFAVNPSGEGAIAVTFDAPYEVVPNIQVTAFSAAAPGVTLGVVQAVQVSNLGFLLEVRGAAPSITVGANWRAGS